MTRIEASTLPQRGVVHTSSGRNSPQTPRPLSPRNDAYNSDVMGIIAELAGKWKYFAPGGLVVEELHFKVPLNHNAPAGEKILLFARSVKRRSSSVKPGSGKPLPWLLYLQGGPGGASPRPQDTAWVGPILDKGYQVLLLDQRGTGLSTPVTAGTLALQGDPIRQAKYLSLFRADSIVHDCEALRKCLTATYPADKKKWSVLGQSFGGFCAVTYLSKFPDGLREVFTTGGLPPLVNNPGPVYERTYRKVQDRNEAYYAKFPQDAERVRKILRYLEVNEIRVPSGGILIPERFLAMGIAFGMHGGLDSVHDIVLKAYNDLYIVGALTRPTLSQIEDASSFDNKILYAVIHEAIYCQRQSSMWAADGLLRQFAGFRHSENPDGIFFTGEMVYQNTFTSSAELCQIQGVANLLAKFEEWPDLYDTQQLARNEVPVYSATYVEDMYVNYDFANQTAAAIKNCKQFITNVMYHNGLRAHSDELLRQLFALRDDNID